MLSTTRISASWSRLLRGSMQRLMRDRGSSSLLLLFTTLMVLVQTLVVFLVGVHAAGQLLMARAGIQLDVLSSAQEQDVQELYAVLRNHPLVEDVTYVTQDQAYERQKLRDPGLIASLEQYKIANPFSDTFLVTLTSVDSYSLFAQDIQQERWRTVVNPSFLTAASTHQNDVHMLLYLVSMAQIAGIVMLIITIKLLVITIRVWAERVEMTNHDSLLRRILGAAGITIFAPHIAHMTLVLLIATIASGALVIAIVFLLPLLFSGLMLEETFVLLRTQMMPLLLTIFPLALVIELFAAPVISAMGIVRKK